MFSYLLVDTNVVLQGHDVLRLIFSYLHVDTGCLVLHGCVVFGVMFSYLHVDTRYLVLQGRVVLRFMSTYHMHDACCFRLGLCVGNLHNTQKYININKLSHGKYW